ncbi:hypothetical protein BGX27_001291 [Mortierella sp. AM989]|nr:hypothetical protein BGX27_001291 [Mortierella sp. AM989]
MLSDQARYGIWFSAIGIEVLAAISLTNNATVTFVGSYLTERLGLFTLIILGESIMGLFMITDDLVDAPGKLGWDNLEARYPGGAAGDGVTIPPDSESSGRAPITDLRVNGFDEGPSHDVLLAYVKKYYLIVAASVFFWNATIKYVTSRPGDKYDRAIYVSRFFMSLVVICLLLVEHQQLGAFSLLGLEVVCCLFQVGHDLLVLYYAARKDKDRQCGSLQ